MEFFTSSGSAASKRDDDLNFDGHEFTIPSRAIIEARDMTKWKTSQSYGEIFMFVKRCTESVVGKKKSEISKLEDGTIACSFVTKFVDFMKLMNAKVDEYPCLQQPMRFGNKAFRQWYECLKTESETFLTNSLPKNLIDQGAVKELAPYIYTSFGNDIRIDYGTGHETTIIIFFLLSYKLQLYYASDLSVVVSTEYIISVVACLLTYLHILK